MATATRIDPLSYLTDQLNELKTKGMHFKLRVLDDEQAPVCTFDGKRVIPSCARPHSKPRASMASAPARCGQSRAQ